MLIATVQQDEGTVSIKIDCDPAKILREQAGLRQYQWRTENTSHSVWPVQGRCCIRRRGQL